MKSVPARTLETVKPSGFQATNLFLVASANMVHTTYASFIAPLLPVLIERLSLLKVEAGIFNLIYLGISILQPAIGRIADRHNIRRLGLLAPAISGIVMSLFGLAPSYPVALLLMVAVGISSALINATLPALIHQLSGNQVGKGMSIWVVEAEVGFLFGPIIITLLLTYATIHTLPWLMIAGILVSLILNVLLKDIPYQQHEDSKQISISFKHLLTVMFPIGGIIMTRSLLRTGTEVFLPVYLTDMGAELWYSGTALSIMLAFGILGSMFGGYLGDHFGYKNIIFISIIVSSLSILAFTFTKGILQIISLCMLGAFPMMILPINMVLVQRSFNSNRSFATGVYLAMLFGIHALANVVVGFLFDVFGGHTTYVISGVVGFLGLPFIFLLPKPEKST
jgi:FSR family fosmidomycin resistance protein-like MFS transporter